MKRATFKLFGWMALSLLLASCDKDDDNATPPQAQVMVVHASPDGPAVDVRVNNTLALSNVTYPSNSPYTPVSAGSTNIKVSPAGTTTYVIDATVNLEAEKNYSVFAIDSVSKIKAAAVTDDLTAPASGKSISPVNAIFPLGAVRNSQSILKLSIRSCQPSLKPT